MSRLLINRISRSQQSKEWIILSLLKLMETQTYSTISITDIARMLQYEYHRNNGGTVGGFDVNKNIDTSFVEEAVKLIGTYE
ncbi:hypothetical protein M3558_05185 [Brevibacillus invocatus]|nr:hypothetical protein [Brevibacillus invocatus]